MKTSTWSHAGPPISATTAAGIAARATGPRKNMPGVASSPSARPTATIIQMTQSGI